jgi:hypothetical protein
METLDGRSSRDSVSRFDSLHAKNAEGGSKPEIQAPLGIVASRKAVSKSSSWKTRPTAGIIAGR